MHILLVEDNAADARLFVEIFRTAALHPNVSIVEDGELALAFLRHEEAYRTASPPDLIMLDLHLLKKDDREVLTEIKADSALCQIPVMVLTSSLAQNDQETMLTLGAERFVRKPIDLKAYFALAQDITEWWQERREQVPPAEMSPFD